MYVRMTREKYSRWGVLIFYSSIRNSVLFAFAIPVWLYKHAQKFPPLLSLYSCLVNKLPIPSPAPVYRQPCCLGWVLHAASLCLTSANAVEDRFHGTVSLLGYQGICPYSIQGPWFLLHIFLTEFMCRVFDARIIYDNE